MRTHSPLVGLALILALCAPVFGAEGETAPPAPGENAPPDPVTLLSARDYLDNNDNGDKIEVTWCLSADDGGGAGDVLEYRIRRSSGPGVAGEVVGSIGPGLVVFVGIATGDNAQDARYLVHKTLHLRVFADSKSKFNLSTLDTRGDLLIISQFTLVADTRRGRRPSFTGAAPPDKAGSLFNLFVEEARASGLKVATGRFQQHMLVEIHNDGPVTVMLDSRESSGND